MNPADTSSIETLVSRDTLTRVANLSAYVSAAKGQADALKVNWSSTYWKGFGYFVKQEHLSRGSLKRSFIPSEAWLDESFMDFAKAYLVEQHLRNPGERRYGSCKRLQALRLLESTLITLRADGSPIGIDGAVLDATATLTRKHLKNGGAYTVGQELKRVVEVLVHAGVVPSSCGTWVNPIKLPKNQNIAVDAESERARQRKLPNHDALYALAEIFNRDFDLADKRCHKDVAVTGVTALLMCAPSRGQEVLRLPENLVFKATDKFGKEQMGLRLHASKGFGSYVKWVWSAMTPVADRAISLIRDITEESRELARHFENPETKHRFYRHANCPDVPDDQPLTREQVCLALGFSAAGSCSSLNSNKLKRKNGSYTLQQLWDTFVLPRHSETHPHFPYVSAADKALGQKGGLKFSEALFCMRKRQLHQRSPTSPVLLWMPELQDIHFEFSGSSSRVSIFERFGYKDENGAPLKVASHQIRHLINTESQRVGLTDEQIAHWSGRLRVAQNATYDHRTLNERVEQTRDIVEAVQATIGLQDSAKTGSYASGHWVVNVIRKPRELADIDGIQPQLSGLKTLYGECHHDWSFAPCEGFVKCLDCSEHACIKGDEDAGVKLERLRALRLSVTIEVAKAEAASQVDVDAQDWLDVQRRYLAKVQQLISLLESEAVPDGAVIRTAHGESPTHLRRALRGMAERALELGAGSKSAMEQLLSCLENDLYDKEDLLLAGGRG